MVSAVASYIKAVAAVVDSDSERESDIVSEQQHITIVVLFACICFT